MANTRLDKLDTACHTLDAAAQYATAAEGGRMNKEYIQRRAMYALIIIKRSLLEDNDLAIKVANTGSIVAAHHIDEIMSGIMRMESDLFDCQMTLKAEKKENNDYRELLGGYTADMLSDEEREKVSALVKEFEKADEESD